MTDDDKALVKDLRDAAELEPYSGQYDAAADRIEALSAENERMEKAIKVQASAVRTLQANEETEINILRKQRLEWHSAVSSLDSEREANAILTAENERLREALQRIAALEDDFESNAAMTAHEWQMFYTARAALGEQQ